MKVGSLNDWLAVVLIAPVPPPPAADVPGPGAPNARTRWTTDEGLPQNSVRCLLQSREGHLWVGTEEGLARFNGSRFTIFDQANTPALRSAHIQCLAEEERGTLWIGTRDGLVARRAGQFIRHAVGTNAAENTLRSLHLTREVRLRGRGCGSHPACRLLLFLRPPPHRPQLRRPQSQHRPNRLQGCTDGFGERGEGSRRWHRARVTHDIPAI